jgi:ribosomal protein L37AE/L43A
MAKRKGKLATPVWITEGYDSPEEYEKAVGKKDSKKKSGKTFKVRECPKCNSDDVGVIVGRKAKNSWECRKCKWEGTEIIIKEFSEDEFMKYLDEKGEEVA